MRRNARDLTRYTPGQRATHWVVGISFILLGMSGLAFFHPAFYPFTMLFGGGTWARILHPIFGVLMGLAFTLMVIRFTKHNLMSRVDWQWIGRIGEMVNGNDEGMPEQGKYNGGQKLLFWLLLLGMLLLIPSGIVLWRAYFDFPVEWVRWAAVVHSATAVVMICLIFVHVYAAIWVTGTIRAMWYGTVTRAWARQHHRDWYRQVTRD